MNRPNSFRADRDWHATGKFENDDHIAPLGWAIVFGSAVMTVAYFALSAL